MPADPSSLAVLDGTAAPPGVPVLGATDPAAPATPQVVPLAITDTREYIAMQPQDAQPTRGVIFMQGALVDPRAYVRILAPIAEAGYLVTIMKSPYDLPITDIGGVGMVIERHPDVTWWAIGGHSLGGVAASTFAAGNPRLTPGLFLWASYPANDISDVDELTVLSVSGANDGLTTPGDIAESVPKLPRNSTFAEVPGAAHWSFGDYGVQAGGGEETVPHEQASAQIAAATLQWLNTASAVA